MRALLFYIAGILTGVIIAIFQVPLWACFLIGFAVATVEIVTRD